MLKRIIFVSVFLFATIAPAQQPLKLSGTITISPDIRGQVGQFIYVKANASNICWHSIDPGLHMVPMSFLKVDDTAIFITMQVGQYRIVAWEKDTRNAPVTAIITVGNDVPVPVPPNPIPVPPNPVPVPPSPSPTISKLRVAIFYESNDLSKLPRAQQLIFSSKATLTYLDAHCIKVGNTPEYRFFDPSTVNFGKESKVWQDAAARTRKSIPWLILLDDTTVIYEDILPISDTDFLNLLKKYEKP